MNNILTAVSSFVRQQMTHLARALNHLSGGKITPNMVTITSFLMHIPLAVLIAQGYFGYAAVGLIIFGLFDALDGALARLQGKDGNAGMLLDASTDRMKEVMLYIGAAFALITQNKAYWAVWAVAACGASLCVSYVKAKGETAVAGGKLSANEINRLFSDGLARYEVRMFLLVVGLFGNWLGIILVVIAVLSAYTALYRLVRITRRLS